MLTLVALRLSERGRVAMRELRDGDNSTASAADSCEDGEVAAKGESVSVSCTSSLEMLAWLSGCPSNREPGALDLRCPLGVAVPLIAARVIVKRDCNSRWHNCVRSLATNHKYTEET
jgi:hypothetical protein